MELAADSVENHLAALAGRVLLGASIFFGALAEGSKDDGEEGFLPVRVFKELPVSVEHLGKEGAAGGAQQRGVVCVAENLWGREGGEDTEMLTQLMEAMRSTGRRLLERRSPKVWMRRRKASRSCFS